MLLVATRGKYILSHYRRYNHRCFIRIRIINLGDM